MHEVASFNAVVKFPPQLDSTNLFKPTDAEMKLQDSFNLITVVPEDASRDGIYNKACQEVYHPQPCKYLFLHRKHFICIQSYQK